MRRIRQESAEVYQVTALEILRALGISTMLGDAIHITPVMGYADQYTIRISGHYEEDIEIRTPDARVYDDDDNQQAEFKFDTELTFVPKVLDRDGC